MERTLNVLDTADAKGKIPDVEVVGNPDIWELVCKASSQSQGWMKSTKRMRVGTDRYLYLISTQQRNPDGSYVLAETMAEVSTLL